LGAILTDAFALEGEEVVLDQAEAIKSRGMQMIDAGEGPFQVDLGALERANSVTVALLMAWYRHAQLREKPILFVNLSQELHNIVEFSGLSQTLLPGESSTP